MKKLLIIVAAMAAALTMCGSSAKASIGITTNFSPLSVSITVITNGVYKETTNTETQVDGRAKIDNSTLLKIFAHWAGMTSWPAGAKLVIGWDAGENVQWTEGTNIMHGKNGDVLVVDGKGTNVLFDCDYNTESNYFAVDFDEDGGPESYKIVEKDPGSATDTEYDYGEFEFLDDNVYLPYTYLYGEGNTMSTYTQNWDAQDNDTTWSHKADMDDAQYAEPDIYWLDSESGQVSGSIKSSGSGKGEDDYGSL